MSETTRPEYAGISREFLDVPPPPTAGEGVPVRLTPKDADRLLVLLARARRQSDPRSQAHQAWRRIAAQITVASCSNP